jgi:hypothetical protein
MAHMALAPQRVSHAQGAGFGGPLSPLEGQVSNCNHDAASCGPPGPTPSMTTRGRPERQVARTSRSGTGSTIYFFVSIRTMSRMSIPWGQATTQRPHPVQPSMPYSSGMYLNLWKNLWRILAASPP